MEAHRKGLEILRKATGRTSILRPENIFLSPVDVAKALKVSRKTVYRRIWAGELPAALIAGRWRTSEAELAIYVSQQKTNRPSD